MRVRVVEVAGGLAVLGIIVLLALTVWPVDSTETTVVTGTDSGSILGSTTEPTTPSPDATADATPGPTPDPTAEPEPAPTEEPSPTPEPPTALPAEQRGDVAVQVVNGGGPTGAAGAATTLLAEQSFQPRGAADAAVVVDGTVVLHREGQGLAARTVAAALGLTDDSVQAPTPDDPNWAAFGGDLDVLVVLGPQIP